MTDAQYQSRPGHKMSVHFQEIEMLYLLDARDRENLMQIVPSVRDGRYKHRVSKREFAAKLDVLRKYCKQNDESDWKRCLVCGICWVDGLIAINNRRLALLAERSKSTLNNTFAKMGLKTIPVNRENRRQLVDQIPYLSDHPDELRQWTYRATLEQFLKMEYAKEHTQPVETVSDDTTDPFEDLLAW